VAYIGKHWRRGALALASVALVWAMLWSVSLLRAKLALLRADAAMKQGFGAIAAEEIDPFRQDVIHLDGGCQLLVASYYDSRRLERLEWSAQSCLRAGKESPDMYIALAGHRELTGRDQDALRILDTAAKKYDQIPEFYRRMGSILLRNKNPDAAASMLMKAAERTPGADQSIVETLQTMVSLEKWPEAKILADRLKSAPMKGAEIKLLIARALKFGDDPTGAQYFIDQAKELLPSETPEKRKTIESIYPDLLGLVVNGQLPPGPGPFKGIGHVIETTLTPLKGPLLPAARPRK
jgi:tetratricopeptide (TPR) repeat protein